MKIRNGFVSNSSSSSFVVGKAYMNKEQIEKLSKLSDDVNKYGVPYEDDYMINYYIDESKYYFCGSGDHCANHYLTNLFNELGLLEYVVINDF